MVSRADVLEWVRRPREGTFGDGVGDPNLIVCYPDEPVGDIADRMVAAEAGRVPVIARNGQRLAGAQGPAASASACRGGRAAARETVAAAAATRRECVMPGTTTGKQQNRTGT